MSNDVIWIYIILYPPPTPWVYISGCKANILGYGFTTHVMGPVAQLFGAGGYMKPEPHTCSVGLYPVKNCRCEVFIYRTNTCKVCSLSPAHSVCGPVGNNLAETGLTWSHQTMQCLCIQ